MITEEHDPPPEMAEGTEIKVMMSDPDVLRPTGLFGVKWATDEHHQWGSAIEMPPLVWEQFKRWIGVR